MKAFTLLMPLALIACGDKSEDTAAEETTEETAFAPQEGGWDVSPLTITEDTCGMGEDEGDGEDEGGIANLTKNEDGSYLLAVGEEGDMMEFTCSLGGMDLTCDAITKVEEDTESEMTWTTSMEVGVTFSSETELTGSLGMDLNCEGNGCAALAEMGMTMPCSLTGEFTATAE